MIAVDRPEHAELRSAVRKLLEQEAPIGRIGADAESERGYDLQLWRRMAQEIGGAGLSVPERFGAILFPAGHSFPDQVKASAYAFLDQWLID